ncbi:MAG: ankyrin repeat domain-containing protein [Candidatus Babeliales bacterium]|jgi:ankyrin repeat protein
MKNMTKCFLVTLALVAGSFHCGGAMQATLFDDLEAGDRATAAKLLTVDGINVNAQSYFFGATALMLASARGYTEIVRMLLAINGIKVNAQDRYGHTALMDLAGARIAPNRSSLYLMCAIALIKAGADITFKDGRGKTALDLARENGNTEIVQLFERYLEAIRDCVADEWRDGLPAGGQRDCPLEVIKEYVMPFLDPDQK